MIALQIHHNEVPLCIAGASDLGVLNAIVNAIGVLGTDSASLRKGAAHETDFFLSVGGLTSREGAPNEHLRWLEHTPLAIGDCLKITLLECEEADLPVKRIESVRHTPDDQRRKFEEAKRTYFQLKETLEPLSKNDASSMIKEHDRVVLTEALIEEGLEPGDIGAVVHVYPHHEAYEVEFVTLTGTTAAVVTVSAEQVRPVASTEIPHARELVHQ